MMGRRFFHWSMKNGAAILFAYVVLSLIVSLGLFAYQFLPSFWAEIGQPDRDMMHGAPEFGLQQLLLANLGAFFQILGTALIPFIGALAIYRFDKWHDAKEAAE